MRFCPFPRSVPSIAASLTLLTLSSLGSALAQEAPIEQTLASDSALTCEQIIAEQANMDKVVANAQSAKSDAEATSTASTAGKVAADVAERTGLFGRFGGAVGSLLGATATKTAADVAKDSANANAQQAAQRATQATARKDALAVLGQGKSCAGVAAPSAAAQIATAPASPSVAEALAAPINLPELNPSEWFDGKTGGTFGEKTVNAFTRSNRVAIVGFRLVFVMHNEASAIKRASYLPGGVETGTAKAKMEVDLKGVDDATLQALTDVAYERFVEQIKATGREVVLPDQFQASYAEFKTSPTPQEVNLNVFRGRAFSPKGMPLWWQVGDSWGDSGLSQTNMRAFNEVSKLTNAIAIAPGIVVDFASMESSGNRSGIGGGAAEVGARLAMSVSTFTTRVVRAEETRYGGIVFKGDDGLLTLTKRVNTEAQFADMQKVEESDKGSVMSLLGALGTKSKKSIFDAKTTNGAYTGAANATLAQATGTFAKLFAVNAVAK